MSGSSGGTTTQLIQPTPPPQPSTAEGIKAYVDSLPALYEAQMKYAPLEAQQQLALAQQYALPLAQAYKSAQDSLYPHTSGLQEQLAKMASEGSTAQVPSWMKDQYHSDLNAQLGSNVNSGAGADYVSRGLMQQQQGYNQYYQNLGLSLAGRQPLANPSSPNYTNQLGNYTPGQGLQYSSQNYGTYAAGSRPIVSQNQQGTPNWIPGMQAAGSLMQGVGSLAAMCFVAAAMFGGWYAPKTVAARTFVILRTPAWFKNFYSKYGRRIAQSKIAVFLLRPLFEYFAFRGKELLDAKPKEL